MTRFCGDAAQGERRFAKAVRVRVSHGLYDRVARLAADLCESRARRFCGTRSGAASWSSSGNSRRSGARIDGV